MTIFYHTSLINISYAQPSISWSKIYSASASGDDANAICNTGNGYYFVGGHSINEKGNLGYVLKINEYGDTLWSKYLQGMHEVFSAIPTLDNGSILSGRGEASCVIRINSDGDVLWLQQFGTDLSTIYDIKKTLDGNYIACGTRSHEFDGIILKFNIDGNLIWLKTYPTGWYKPLKSIDILLNGGYITTGTNQDFPGDTAKTLLMRIDDSGEVIWEKRLMVLNETSEGGYIKRINNSFILCGSTIDTANVTENLRNYLIKTDTSGNVNFVKLFEYYKNDVFQSAQYLSDNKFIFSSISFSNQSNDTSFNKVFICDTSGNINATKNFYSEFSNSFYSATLALNNDILLAGYIEGRMDDILICRIDSNLQGPPIGIKVISTLIPENLHLYQNYPNPFNPSTNIRFDIVKDSKVSLVIYDMLGREVSVLINEQMKPGTYKADWNAANYPSGIYFYKLATNDYTQTRKMILIK